MIATSDEGDCLTPRVSPSCASRSQTVSGLISITSTPTLDPSRRHHRRERPTSPKSPVTFRNGLQAWPVVVMGDTNSRYTIGAGDSESWHTILNMKWSQHAMGDERSRAVLRAASGAAALVLRLSFRSWNHTGADGGCEVVDKVLTRSSPAINLQKTTFTNENNAFVNSTGAPLSDHYPVSSVITWSLSSSIRLAEPVGGPHGSPFNDIPAVLSGNAVPQTTTITLRGGNRLDAISYAVKYPNGTTSTVTHGGTGGMPSTLTLNSGNASLKSKHAAASS
ncbi:hypothetical protein Hypma_003765 [Hypsizygus marmoreus]|uniref:Jacalin-type lectin domain-containing protein n=1 Tax=Hypsizygus marmoreus TaxID=39966 RepID=A0A369J5P4_HYPMA|nr:hypothetical protein Hypma_003765 [Hypsizygus marmoreus]